MYAPSKLVPNSKGWVISSEYENGNSCSRLLPNAFFYYDLPFPIRPLNSNKLFFKVPPPKLISPNLHHNRHFLPSAIGNGTEDEKGGDCELQDIARKNADQEEKEAVQAVAEIIHGYGGDSILKEESYEIALNSPNYIRMLVDSVREWNDLELSFSPSNSCGDSSYSASKSSCSNREERGGASYSSSSLFKKKVFEMGLQKGDKGIVPFLEGVVGLSLPSAMHVFRCYLSSQTLPDLITKVKYVKEILFSDSDDEGLLGENARRMMIYLSIPIDEDLQQTLSFLEKIQARRGGLNLLGSVDASFRHLIESFPHLLLLPLESHMRPIVEFLEEIGIPKGCIRNVILLFPPIIFYDIEKDIKPRLLAFKKVNAGSKDLGKILLKYPWILSTSIHGNFKKIRSFFDKEKVPKTSVERAIRSWPHLLGCSLGKMTFMVEQFGELGIRNKKLGQVIAKSPQLVLQKPHEFFQVVSFLKELGFDEETVGRILGRCPEIFSTNIERTLKKKLDFLTSIGVSKDFLPRVIRKYPELFVCDVNRALRPRTKYLVKIGLSERDVAFMVRSFSPILGYSIKEVLRPKLEFLVNTMRKPLRDVVTYPRYFSYSLEKKIKPRYWVLKGRNVECSLKDMLGKNEEEFAAEFMGVGRMLVPPRLWNEC